MVELGLERLLFNKNIEPILCTTKEAGDDKLITIAKKLGVRYYRGSTTDILNRYLGATKKYNADFFVTVDGDDLFVDNFYINKIVEKYQKTKADYIYYKNLPYGTFGFGIKPSALEKVCAIKDDDNTEGWGRYFTKTKLFKTASVRALKKHNHPEYRLTLDYEEDLKLIKTIYENLYGPGGYLTLNKVLDFLNKNPKIARANWNRKNEYEKRFKEKYSKIYLKN